MGKISSSLRGSGNSGLEGGRAALPQTFVIDEEECFVFALVDLGDLDRPAEASAELAALEVGERRAGRLAKKLLESSSDLRRNSKALP